MAQPDLSPILQRRRTIEDDYAAKSVANTFSRNLGNTRASREVGDFQQGFARSFPSFAASFGQRGLSGGGIKSGAMQNAMKRYVGDYTQGLGRLHQDNANQMRQYDFTQGNFDAERNALLADLEMQKAQTIAQTAYNIQALRPMMGGY